MPCGERGPVATQASRIERAAPDSSGADDADAGHRPLLKLALDVGEHRADLAPGADRCRAQFDAEPADRIDAGSLRCCSPPAGIGSGTDGVHFVCLSRRQLPRAVSAFLDFATAAIKKLESC